MRAVGFATAALAAITIGRTIFQIEDATAQRKKCSSNNNSSSCSSASASASASAFVTAGSDPSSNPYETQVSVYEYLLMHFGGEAELINYPQLQGEQMKNATSFPLQCAQMAAHFVKTVPAFVEAGEANLRALDIGCSVGRSSFEMTRDFGTVVGLDYSNAFVDAANKLKESGEMAYEMRLEGDLKQKAVARVDPQLDRSRVSFVQGDACDLSLAALGGRRFHVILGANLLCRLPFPRRFLAALPALVEPLGFVVLPSPYTWLEQYTPKSEWVGGYIDQKTGKEVRSADELQTLMEGAGHFKLVSSSDVAFFIRETARKNQWSVSHVTVWQRTLTPA